MVSRVAPAVSALDEFQRPDPVRVLAVCSVGGDVQQNFLRSHPTLCHPIFRAGKMYDLNLWNHRSTRQSTYQPRPNLQPYGLPQGAGLFSIRPGLTPARNRPRQLSLLTSIAHP